MKFYSRISSTNRTKFYCTSRERGVSCEPPYICRNFVHGRQNEGDHVRFDIDGTICASDKLTEGVVANAMHRGAFTHAFQAVCGFENASIDEVPTSIFMCMCTCAAEALMLPKTLHPRAYGGWTRWSTTE